MTDYSDHNIIEQAVYGYSRGHRELRSSVSLSSADTYELAALTDLAPGARLSADESYLSGMLLPSGGHYALVRTWLAQEMPRPGCVWSHVFLIPRQTLTTQVDLSVFYPLFRRPHEYQTDETFVGKIMVPMRGMTDSHRPAAAVDQLLSAVYLGGRPNHAALSAEQWDRAVLAVWSQQWPALRRRFVFRSVPTSAKLNGQAFEFRDGGLGKLETQPTWLGAATEDAVSTKVTPLRRFLWRYGKDIASPAAAYQDLVRFYLKDGFVPPAELTVEVFKRFGQGQADTLKRDLLGLNPRPLALVQRVEKSDLAHLLSSCPEAMATYYYSAAGGEPARMTTPSPR
ncbi:hypothetical protein GOB57_21865 [Sinorhizobium meliloti]|nr:hypothetical protein [Sinorhizobium meliloti]